jgi:hypothetical protein
MFSQKMLRQNSLRRMLSYCHVDFQNTVNDEIVLSKSDMYITGRDNCRIHISDNYSDKAKANFSIVLFSKYNPKADINIFSITTSDIHRIDVRPMDDGNLEIKGNRTKFIVRDYALLQRIESCDSIPIFNIHSVNSKFLNSCMLFDNMRIYFKDNEVPIYDFGLCRHVCGSEKWRKRWERYIASRYRMCINDKPAVMHPYDFHGPNDCSVRLLR